MNWSLLGSVSQLRMLKSVGDIKNGAFRDQMNKIYNTCSIKIERFSENERFKRETKTSIMRTSMKI